MNLDTTTTEEQFGKTESDDKPEVLASKHEEPKVSEETVDEPVDKEKKTDKGKSKKKNRPDSTLPSAPKEDNTSKVTNIFNKSVGSDGAITFERLASRLLAVEGSYENGVRQLNLSQDESLFMYRPSLTDQVYSGVASLLLHILREPVASIDPSSWVDDAHSAAAILAQSINRLFDIAAAPLGGEFSTVSQALAVSSVADALNTGGPDSVNSLIQDTLAALPRTVGSSHVLHQFGTWLYNAGFANTLLSTIFDANAANWARDPLTQIAQISALANSISGQRDQDMIMYVHSMFPHVSVLINEGRVSESVVYGDIVGTGTPVGVRLTALVSRYLGTDEIQLENEFTLQNPSAVMGAMYYVAPNVVTGNQVQVPPIPATTWLTAVGRLIYPAIFNPTALDTFIDQLVEDVSFMLRLKVYSAISTGNRFRTPAAYSEDYARDVDVRSAVAKKIVEIVASFNLCRQAAVQLVAGTILARISEWANVASQSPDRLVDIHPSNYPSLGLADLGTLIPTPSTAGIISTQNVDLHFGDPGPVAGSPMNDKGYTLSAQVRSLVTSLKTVNDMVTRERLWEMTLTRTSSFIGELLSAYSSPAHSFDVSSSFEAPVLSGAGLDTRILLQDAPPLTNSLKPYFIHTPDVDSDGDITGSPLVSHYGMFNIGTRYTIVRNPDIALYATIELLKSSSFSQTTFNPNAVYLNPDLEWRAFWHEYYSQWSYIIGHIVGLVTVYDKYAVLKPVFAEKKDLIPLPIAIDALKNYRPDVWTYLQTVDIAYLNALGVDVDHNIGQVIRLGDAQREGFLHVILSHYAAGADASRGGRNTLSYSPAFRTVSDRVYFIRSYDIFESTANPSYAPVIVNALTGQP
jgi:hypothetical protein